jgi:hypothetical protein
MHPPKVIHTLGLNSRELSSRLKQKHWIRVSPTNARFLPAKTRDIIPWLYTASPLRTGSLCKKKEKEITQEVKTTPHIN